MKRKESFLLQQVGDENLLVPIGAQVMDTNGIITLNASAVLIWEQLVEEKTEAELAAGLVERFDVGHDRAVADVRTFIGELRENGLLA
ncbi:hypothetical protein CHL67_02410 [Prosthecochloris sp. GSB1]|uniref:PqqD family protein n=1 Tax=Prosthecochloris sp. GSB1 TaxID=281093 RepID=UPI000B8CE642|nr:PqqD family protein [Prosthecochloris sp. GSB1]ASQ89925.1 hypothetical protein CHL67_02410 [Prosthecochloris sp. GSB1]